MDQISTNGGKTWLPWFAEILCMPYAIGGGAEGTIEHIGVLEFQSTTGRNPTTTTHWETINTC